MNPSNDIKPKIFLLGMMGSGKSYWTKFLSKKLKTGGYDLDYLIESNEEKSIAEIFSEDGEEYFRKQESKILKWFKKKKLPF
jgi:shikimate kinase